MQSLSGEALNMLIGFVEPLLLWGLGTSSSKEECGYSSWTGELSPTKV